MKKKFVSILALIVLAAMVLTGCGSGETGKPGKTGEIDCNALLQSLRSNVQFDTELKSSKNAALAFPDLPEGSQVVLYTGSGAFADRLALLTLPKASDRKAARAVVDKHIAEVRDQVMKYAPEEVGKLDSAIIYEHDNCILLCVTNDLARARDIIDHADDPSYVPDGTPAHTAAPAASEKASTDGNQQAPEHTEPDGDPMHTEMAGNPGMTEQATEAETEGEEPDDGSYPVLKSQEGIYHSYGDGFIRVDNHAFEGYGFVESSAKTYAGLVNQVADALAGTKTKVYSLPIPTAPGIVLPDDIKEQMSYYVDQGQAIDTIFSMMNDNVIPVNCYSNLMRHRDEYLYFRTDYHWNGRGAYYAYETFCNVKGVKPYTLDQRELKEFDNYLGILYESCCDKDPVLSATPDTVEAYCPVSKEASMTFTDRDGVTTPWSIITDVSDWNSGSKYNTFAGSDQPFAEFTNPAVTDGSVAVIVKDSYGNALLPFLVDHYSTVYEIDYRYWTGNLADFVREKNADDLIIAHNLVMISSDYLINMFNEIV